VGSRKHTTVLPKSSRGVGASQSEFMTELSRDRLREVVADERVCHALTLHSPRLFRSHRMHPVFDSFVAARMDRAKVPVRYISYAPLGA